jgi:hypothetical protein
MMPCPSGGDDNEMKKKDVPFQNKDFPTFGIVNMVGGVRFVLSCFRGAPPDVSLMLHTHYLEPTGLDCRNTVFF